MTSKKLKSLTYKSSGVDINAGESFINKIKPLIKSTNRIGSFGQIGGFGGFFDIKAIGYHDPLLVATTDGVGTKLEIAIEINQHDTIGIDLVAMCVNDLIVQGAEPLFFLDYLVTNKLDLKIAELIITGMVTGCQIANCDLIGGETAEHPNSATIVSGYDIAGSAIGAVERNNILPRNDIDIGDIILGLASSGLHSNGFSLVRKIIKENNLSYFEKTTFGNKNTLGEELLEPTRIYVSSCLAAHRAGLIKGLAHITGGGLIKNIPRILPDNLSAVIDINNWIFPNVFKWISSYNINIDEMLQTFNCGIGMAVIVSSSDEDKITKLFIDYGETVYKIGSIIRRKNKKQITVDTF